MKLLIHFLQPILQDSSEITLTVGTDYELEQRHVARLVHLAVHDDPNYYFQMLEMFREQFYNGGENRMKYTIPALVVAYIKLVRYIKQCHEHRNDGDETEAQETTTSEDDLPPTLHDKKLKFFKGQINVSYSKLFQLMKQAVEKIASAAPETALRLNLEIVQSISEVDEQKEVSQILHF